MPTLKNARHEIYARGKAGGMTGAKAFSAAGYKQSDPKNGASKLEQRNPLIRERITELERERAERLEETIESKTLLTQLFVLDETFAHLEKCKSSDKYEAAQVTNILKMMGQQVGLFNPERKTVHRAENPFKGKTVDEIKEILQASYETLGLRVVDDRRGSTEESAGAEDAPDSPVRALH